MDKELVIETTSALTKIVVGSGVGTIVGSVVKRVIPLATANPYVKVSVTLASCVLSAVATQHTDKYINQVTEEIYELVGTIQGKNPNKQPEEDEVPTEEELDRLYNEAVKATEEQLEFMKCEHEAAKRKIRFLNELKKEQPNLEDLDKPIAYDFAELMMGNDKNVE